MSAHIQRLPKPHEADPNKPWEVHFLYEGERYVDAYATEALMRARTREIIEEDRVDPRNVSMFYTHRRQIKRPIAEITREVITRRQLTLKELREWTKRRVITKARQEVCYLCSREGWSDEETSQYLFMTRSNVSYMVRRAIELGEEPIIGRDQRGHRRVRLNTTPAERLRDKRRADYEVLGVAAE